MNSFNKDARNLAEATLRLCTQLRLDHPEAVGKKDGILYPLEDAEGEAMNIMAKTVGA